MLLPVEGVCGCSGGSTWLLGDVRGCSRGGMVAPGGCVWLLLGGMHGCSWEAMCGCSGGACVVAPGGMHGCSWGDVHGCSGEACVVAPGDMHGCPGGVCGCSQGGACMVAPRVACMVAPGGMHGCSWGACAWDMMIRSMSGRYSSYWNAFLFYEGFYSDFFGKL